MRSIGHHLPRLPDTPKAIEEMINELCFGQGSPGVAAGTKKTTHAGKMKPLGKPLPGGGRDNAAVTGRPPTVLERQPSPKPKILKTFRLGIDRVEFKFDLPPEKPLPGTGRDGAAVRDGPTTVLEPQPSPKPKVVTTLRMGMSRRVQFTFDVPPGKPLPGAVRDEMASADGPPTGLKHQPAPAPEKTTTFCCGTKRRAEEIIDPSRMSRSVRETRKRLQTIAHDCPQEPELITRTGLAPFDDDWGLLRKDPCGTLSLVPMFWTS